MNQQMDRLAAVRGIVLPLLRQATGVNDDTPLVSGGRLDSMAVVELVVDLEDHFGVRIPSGSVRPLDFDSIRRIVDTVDRFAASRDGS